MEVQPVLLMLKMGITHSIFRRLSSPVRVIKTIKITTFLFVVAILVLMLGAGCSPTAKEENAYRDKISSIVDRYDDNVDKFKQREKELENYAENMFATEPVSYEDAVNKVNAMCDAFVPLFQEILTMFRQVHAELAAIQPPPKLADAHSIYNSGMTTIVLSAENFINEFNSLRNLRDFEDLSSLDIKMNNTVGFIEQGLDNIEKADDMVFAVNWGLIVLIIIVTLFAVASIIAIIVSLSHRRRRALPALPSGPVPPEYSSISEPRSSTDMQNAPGGYVSPADASSFRPSDYPSDAYASTDRYPPPEGSRQGKRGRRGRRRLRR